MPLLALSVHGVRHDQSTSQPAHELFLSGLSDREMARPIATVFVDVVFFWFFFFIFFRFQ